jgi:hypothetical protein
MVDRFDLESRIMECWKVVNDLNSLYEHVCDSDKIDHDEMTNILLGLKQLYDIKFDQLFFCFEENIKNGRLK